MDRERLADIFYAVRDLPEFDALYDLGSRAVIAVSDGPRAGIAARLTALPPMQVDIAYRPTFVQQPVIITSAELAAARARHEARVAEWSTYRFEPDANYPTHGGIAFVIVSAKARAYAGAILEFSAAPVRTYATANVDHVEELVAIHRLKPVFVLDEDLDGTKALSTRLNGAVVRWISSSRARVPEDVEAILSAIMLPSRRALRDAGTFSKLRILVVDRHDGSLDREAQRAAPGAHFERAIGWDALERIGDEELDVVIAGEPRDVSLASLARFVQRCKTTPLLLIASNRLTTERMRSKHPKLARYFIERPLCAEDLLCVLRR